MSSLTKQQKSVISDALAMAESLGKSQEWGFQYAADQAGVDTGDVIDYLNQREQQKSKKKK